jgi:hypothetical protein
MSTALESMLAAPAAAEQTIEAALARYWERPSPSEWRRQTQHGECALAEIAHRDRWRQFQLSGGWIQHSDSSCVLERNAKLFGPVKLIIRPPSDAVCRVDVPETLAVGGGHTMWSDGQLQFEDAAARWAAAVTACATGERVAPRWNDDVAGAAADELKQAGWSASLDEGQLYVHLQLPGIYRQLAFERDAKTGVKLATELVELTGLDDVCIRAMKLVANEVNARLPLVRLAISGSSRRRALRAEVGFGAALIPGAMLLWSLHAFETAAALCVREFEALCVPALARLVLAAAAARESAI